MAGRERMLRLLSVFAVTVVCLGSVIATVIYADAHSSIATENAVTHTQRMLLDLGEIAREVDRVELNSLLYLQGHQEDYLRAAQGSTVALNTLALRLEHLAENNGGEKQRAQDLGAAIALLGA